jgi:hypothetical protein
VRPATEPIELHAYRGREPPIRRPTRRENEMSIGVGTLQPKARIMRPVWLAGFLAVILALAVAVVVTNADEEPARDATATQTAVSGTAANTPSELRGVGTEFGGTLANTPSEIRPHVPRRAGEGSSQMEPYEIAIERYARHQLR